MLYVDQTQLCHLSLTCHCFILKYVKKEKSNHLLIQRVIVSTFLDGEHWCATLQLCNCATLQLCSFATVQLSDHLVQSQLCNCETIQCIFNCAFMHSEKNPTPSREPSQKPPTILCTYFSVIGVICIQKWVEKSLH